MATSERLEIISKKAGFRRCGIEHLAEPVIYPAGTFTEEQVKMLKAEPMLIVREVPEPAENNEKAGQDDGGKNEMTGKLDPKGLEKWKLDDLKKLAADMELDIPEGATKKQLIERVTSQPVIVDKDAIVKDEE